MTVLRRTAVAAPRLLLGVQNLFVISAGFSLLSTLPLWAPLHSDGRLRTWVELLQDFHLKMTVVFLVIGVAIFWLHFSWNRGARPAPTEHSPWSASEILMACGAALLAIWVVASSAPWRSMWTEGVALLDSMGIWQAFRSGEEMSGLFAPVVVAVLMIPGLQLATATSFLISSSAVLLLLWAGNRHTTNALIQCTLVQGAFLVAIYFSNDLAERLSQPLLELLRSAAEAEAAGVQAWIQGHLQQANLGLRHLAGPFIGYLLLVPLSELRASQARLAMGQHAVPFGERAEAASDSPADPPDFSLDATGAAQPPWIPAERPAENAAATELQHSAYIVRPATSLLLSFLPGPRPYEITTLRNGPHERVLFRTVQTAGINRMVRPDGSTVVGIRPMGSFLSGVFEVLGEDQRRLGVFKREGVIRPPWVLLDGHGTRLGSARIVDLGIRLVRYAVELQEQEACTLTWRVYGTLSHQMEVDFSSDRLGRLDRRLGLALAVVLESKARFWAHVHNN